ncbi:MULTISPECIES: protoglobin domain-containing protein [unclassified Meiothermus]|uniref:protoglobin domain-containing protein n=1 Tax=unclassified Meiothermus TaxID=370471 RepID=UPI001F44AD88|nr:MULTISPECIES: protoglobin domain-containing protein [unclassified Meiothermus]
MPTEKSLAEFYRKAQLIWEQIPPPARLQPRDGRILAKHQDLLLSWEDRIVQGFYDTLFQHPPTQRIFHPGERPIREATLRRWWRRTVSGPFNGEYFAWQALVGLVHVKRQVSNAMMAGMWGWMVERVSEEARQELGEQSLPLIQAFSRLAASVSALIAQSYLDEHLAALARRLATSQEKLEEEARREAGHHLSHISP